MGRARADLMRTLSLLALVLCSGCVTTRTLRPGELARLDGYDRDASEQPKRMLEATRGKPVAFDREASLKVQLRNGTVVEGRPQRLELDAPLGQLRGTLVGGRTFSLDLTSIAATRVSSLSRTRTTILLVGILAGILSVTGTVLALSTVDTRSWRFPSLSIRLL